MDYWPIEGEGDSQHPFLNISHTKTSIKHLLQTRTTEHHLFILPDLIRKFLLMPEALSVEGSIKNFILKFNSQQHRRATQYLTM